MVHTVFVQISIILICHHSRTYGSGECMGEEAWRMYWVHWNTLNARLARKSLAESSPATGRSMNPVRSACTQGREKAVNPLEWWDQWTLHWLMGVFVVVAVVTFQEAGHVFQLRNVVWAVPTVPLQQTEGLEVFAAGVGDVQVPQGWIDLPPNQRHN